MRRLSRTAVSLAALASALAWARPSLAVDCRMLARPLFVAGSTAAKPLLAEVGKTLAAANPAATIVYKEQGSCNGVQAILEGTRLADVGPMALSYWDVAGVEQRCDIESAGLGPLADIGISDVFASTCFPLPGGLPVNIADFRGPIQTMTFVVPRASPEMVISAEAAYSVFGLGASSGVSPWTNEAFLFQRDALSGTQRMIAVAIGVPPHRWRGITTTSSGDLAMRLGAVTNPPEALGILSADVAATKADTLRVLAYQHFGYGCGAWPDRELTSKEKANVRNGRYAIWGPLHLFTRINSGGTPVSALAAEVIGYVTGTRPTPPALDIVGLGARHNVVPACAMRVMRGQEMGPLTPFAPPDPCGCYFEKVANGATACTPCARQTDCPTDAPTCSYGYCEP